MGQRIAGGMDLPAVEKKILLTLGCFDGIHHHRQITGSGIFHSYRNAGAAGNHTMQLVFYGPGTNGAIGKKIRQVTMIFRIQDFFCTGKAGLLDDMNMHATNGLDSFHHIFLPLRIRLVQHTFVPFTNGPRFIGINPGNNEKTILHFVRHLSQTAAIVQYSRLIICRAGADNQEESIILTGHNVSDFLIPFFF